MSAVQRRLYNHLQKHGVLLNDGETKDKEGTATGSGAQALHNTLMQLRKICNHPYIFESVEKGMSRHLNFGGAVVNDLNLWRVSGE